MGVILTNFLVWTLHWTCFWLFLQCYYKAGDRRKQTYVRTCFFAKLSSGPFFIGKYLKIKQNKTKKQSQLKSEWVSVTVENAILRISNKNNIRNSRNKRYRLCLPRGHSNWFTLLWFPGQINFFFIPPYCLCKMSPYYFFIIKYYCLLPGEVE